MEGLKLKLAPVTALNDIRNVWRGIYTASSDIVMHEVTWHEVEKSGDLSKENVRADFSGIRTAIAVTATYINWNFPSKKKKKKIQGGKRCHRWRRPHSLSDIWSLRVTVQKEAYNYHLDKWKINHVVRYKSLNEQHSCVKIQECICYLEPMELPQSVLLYKCI